MKKLLLTLLIILFACFSWQICFADTYYVSPSGSNTSPYDTWVKAATAVQTAINAATSSADIVEIDGGTSGETYTEALESAAINITIKGSIEYGHDGTVSIDSNGLADYTLNVSHADTTLENVVLKNSDTNMYNLRWVQTGGVVNDVTLQSGHKAFLTNQTVTLNRCSFLYHTAYVGGAKIENNSPVFNYCRFFDNSTSVHSTSDDNPTFNNCLFLGDGRETIKHDDAAGTVTINNCAFVGGSHSYNFHIIRNINGTINLNYSLVLPKWNNPGTYFLSGVTESNNIYRSPIFVNSRRPGILHIWIDDYANLAHFKDVADAADDLGFYINFALSTPQSVTSPEWSDLQTLVNAGHTVAAHGTNHFDLTKNGGIDIQYVGAGSACTMDIATNTLTTQVTGGPGGEDLDIDLTNASYDFLSELISYIDGLAAYTCSLNTNGDNNCMSKYLTDVSSQDIRTAEYNAQASQTKINIGEIRDCVTEIESNLTYTVEVFATHGGLSNETIEDFIKGEGLIGSRVLTLGDWKMEDFEIFKAYGLAASSVIGTASSAIIKRNTNAICEAADAIGGAIGILDHGSGVFSLANWEDVFDAIDESNVMVKTFDDTIQYIKDNGTDADTDGERWTRTFTEGGNYHLMPQSLCMEAGTDVGLTADYDGSPIISNPDIGNYEYTMRVYLVRIEEY